LSVGRERIPSKRPIECSRTLVYVGKLYLITSRPSFSLVTRSHLTVSPLSSPTTSVICHHATRSIDSGCIAFCTIHPPGGSFTTRYFLFGFQNNSRKTGWIVVVFSVDSRACARVTIKHACAHDARTCMFIPNTHPCAPTYTRSISLTRDPFG
jgi:hypothetical protein